MAPEFYPDSSEWILDETSVVLPREDFKRLRNYSSTNPTGVSNGKVWARTDHRGEWVCWYEVVSRVEAYIRIRRALVVS